MHRRVPVTCLALAATVLSGCAGREATAPPPRPPSTPPPVQRTVAAGSVQDVEVHATTQPTTPAATHSTTHSTTHPGAHATTHVMPDGRQMSGMSMAGSTVPNGTGPHAVAAPNVDGCNRSYGLVSQCVPVRAPGGGPLTCAFLHTYHLLPLLVTEDPLRLLTRTGATVRVVGGKRYLTGCSA